MTLQMGEKFGLFSDLLRLLNQDQRRMGWFLLVGIIVAAAPEAIGIGLVFPLFAILADPIAIEKSVLLSGAFNLDPASNVTIVHISIALAAVFVVKNLLLGILNYMRAANVQGVSTSTARRLLQVYLTHRLSSDWYKRLGETTRHNVGEVIKSASQALTGTTARHGFNYVGIRWRA